jgi:AmiR/NasT family two-component response regulator
VKRVFVLSSRSIFLQGIETLLSEEDGFEIVGQNAGSATAVECILKHNPDIVILNLDDPEPDISPAVLCVLKKRAGISLVGLSLRDNKICIFRGEEQQVRQVEDLYHVLQD